MIQILYWDNYGNFELKAGDKIYKFKEVYQPDYESIRRILRSRKPNFVWTYLKGFKYDKPQIQT